MKKVLLIPIFTGLLICNFASAVLAQDFEQEQKVFYIGLGTKLSTYIGGEFGSRFGIRFANSYDPYNERSNYYYDDEYNYYNDRETHSLNPLEFNLVGGYNINEYMAMELEAGISFHTNGYLDANQYTIGTEGTTQYVQHFDNSSMMMLPIMASFKYFPFGKSETPIFLSGGYGVQYVDESLDLVRDYNVYENYYYGYGTYRVRMDNYSASGWMNGFKVGTGTTLSLFGNLKTDIEINYLKFFNSNTDENSSLAFQKTSSFGNISLGTKIYFGF
jgi:opacity protein-like surface antigen